MRTVEALRVAPVKGLRAVRRERVHIDRSGVAEDRRLFLVDGDGAVVTSRRHPGLVAVVPDLDLAERRLRLTLPDGGVVTADLDALGAGVQTRLFGKDRSGRVLGGEAAAALSDLVGEPIRLVLADGPGVGWDEGPVSLIGSASVAAVPAPSGAADRYRMLIEVSGTVPFEEDSWVGRDVIAGSAVLRISHQLVRCVVITREPTTGAHDWDGLEELRRVRGENGLCLGVIAEVAEPGGVAVGDQVRALG